MTFDFSVFLFDSSDVIRLHDIAITRFGEASGIRDRGLLESAVHQPIMMINFGNKEDRKIHHLGAAYFFHIIKNHPFIDRNKRTGLASAIKFFDKNSFNE